MSLHWENSKTFTIDDCRFTIDVNAGPARRLSTDNNFTLVKTRRFLSMYETLAPMLTGKTILELGMFEGGSLVYLDKRFSPRKLVGVDIRTDPIEPLERYIATRDGAVKAYYATSQSDEAALDRICRDDFGGQVDAVIDDASHAYKLTKQSFDCLFGKVVPGGIYVIEDWAWSYQPAHQSWRHPRFWTTGLATLLFELIGDIASNTAIDEVRVDRNMAVITKSSGDSTPLTYGRHRLRGRPSPRV